jgi:hypothetical protein
MSDELPSELTPLAFLIGSWCGEGRGEYPTIEAFDYRQELLFSYYGKPVLAYESRSWAPDGRPLARESGFWRPRPGGAVEVLLAHPSGLAELYIGQVADQQVEIVTDEVVRAPSAKEVTTGRRTYRVRGEELSYVFEMAAVGQPLQAHLSGRLTKSGPASG